MEEMRELITQRLKKAQERAACAEAELDYARRLVTRYTTAIEVLEESKCDAGGGGAETTIAHPAQPVLD